MSGRSDLCGSPCALALSLLMLAVGAASAQQDAAEDEQTTSPFAPGLVAAYEDHRGVKYVRVERCVALKQTESIGEGQAIAVSYDGYVHVQTPGKYQFTILHSGSTRLLIDDKVVIDHTTTDEPQVTSREVDLSFGRHALRIVYQARGATHLQLYWQSDQFPIEPIPERWLSHEAAKQSGVEQERGRRLVRAARCAACHQERSEERYLSAPALDRLTDALYADWIVERLTEEPNSEKPESANRSAAFAERKMPHFALSDDEARAIAAYLLSSEAAIRKEADSATGTMHGDKTQGETLFLTRGCLACHTVSNAETEYLFSGGSLSQVAAKRPAEFFEQWLAKPQDLNRDHRMPTFDLTTTERGNLSAYLAGLGEPAATAAAPDATPPSKEQIDRGKQLVATHRCGACHRLPDGAEKSTPIATTIRKPAKAIDWANSCLGKTATSERSLRYSFSDSQAKAIRSWFDSPFVADKLPDAENRIDPSAAIHTAYAVSQRGRQVLEENNCLACHRRGNDAGIAESLPAALAGREDLIADLPRLQPPALDSIGDKLTAAALHASIAKPTVRRNWLQVRMPTFSLSDTDLAAIKDYFIACDRVPPVVEVSEPNTLAIAGRRLVTADGFGCTSCHQIGRQEPHEVAPAAQGPNLSLLGERIRRPWYDRWMRDPARIVPRMEMPAVRVPVPGVLHGDLNQQLAAVWNVLNQPDFEPPAPDAIRVLRKHNYFDHAEPAAVLTDNLDVAGKVFVKPLLVALGNRHNVLFDQQRYRLADWRIGDAARQRTRKKYWYWEAGGTSLLRQERKSGSSSELQLIQNNQHVSPEIDLVIPPSFDRWELTGNGLRFSTRLRFRSPRKQNDATSVTVAQHFTAVSDSKQHGFERTVEFSGNREKLSVNFDWLPGNEVNVASDRRTAQVVGAPCKIRIVTAGVRFEPGNSARTVLKPEDSANQVVVVYETTLPHDRFLTPEVPVAINAPEPISLLPGFQATKLPLPREVMPTGFAWRENGNLLFTSLKGRVWEARDSDQDELEDVAEQIRVELVAPYGIATVTLPDGTEALNVVDKTGLLQLSDRTGEGYIDRVETLADGWGHSSDYHGWAVGLPKDERGNYYVAVAQRQGPEQLLIGRVLQLAQRSPTLDDPRQYAIKPLTRGSRFPLGIARNRSGDLFVTDNQGQYTVYNELNHVTPGAHFGHPSGLPADQFKAHPKQGPAVAIPHPWTRSVNGICFLETPKAVREKLGRDLFGPWEGHLVGCEYDTRRLIRISLQRVGDRFQGAAYPLSLPATQDEPQLLGPVVCAIAPDGDLYIGSLRDSAWGAGQNTGEIVRARFTGELPAGIAEVRSVSDGLQVMLSTPVDPARLADPRNYVLSSYRRVVTPAYGGPDVDRREEKIVGVQPAADAKSVVIRLSEMRSGHVYELHLQPLVAKGRLFHPAEAHFTFGPIPQ